jgi:hypothetical protein
LYLPLYNGVTSVEIGIPKGSKLTGPAGPRPKPIVIYGTSITHGGCASRPGMAFPAIMGRQLETPVINLGFSGSGRMEPAMAVLLARKQVKAWLFGHSHRWRTDKHEDLHLVNLPTMAYVFDKAQPAGWVDAQLRPDGMTLRLSVLDHQHPDHGKSLDLAWRK